MTKDKEDDQQRSFLIPEEFPEGPYGAPIGVDSPVENKSSALGSGQRYLSAFNYENKSLHAQLPRKFPGAHPTHDDPEKTEQAPYSTSPD